MSDIDIVFSLLSEADADNREVAAQMEQFLQGHPDALWRTCLDGHFTASALVVEENTENFLVLHHTKLRKWLQPGGHVDGSNNFPQSALREAKEETGIENLRVVEPFIDLDIHLVEPPKEQPHLHLDIRYLVLAPQGSVFAPNHESTEMRWVTMDDLSELQADESLVRLATRGLARIGR
ncbi:MAG: hypothetical protein RLZZ31_827 [Actinomycetota bacterium]